jgi:4-hydroxybenzoate polyprenyltransferase
MASGQASPERRNLLSRAAGRLRLYADLVMLGHSVFSLPFAVAALLLASGGHPGWKVLGLTVCAFLGARNAANALNRLIDRKLDAENPRTAGRHLPSGQIGVKETIALTAFFGLLFIVPVLFLPRLCLYLLPVAAALLFFYSFTKRFTWLCHLVLGVCSAAASVGGWIAFTGRIEFPCLVLAAANASWVCGFDIIYQTMDAEWDRGHGLHSIPADFGLKPAMVMAALCHAATLAFLTFYALYFKRGPFFLAGLALLAALFVLEHLAANGAVRPRPPQGRILFSAYTMNQIISPVFLAAVALDVYFGGIR